MLNHSTNNNAEFSYDPCDGSLGVQATAEIKKGEQVFISYGNRSDDEMIADYGFCLGLDDTGIMSN